MLEGKPISHIRRDSSLELKFDIRFKKRHEKVRTSLQIETNERTFTIHISLHPSKSADPTAKHGTLGPTKVIIQNNLQA